MKSLQHLVKFSIDPKDLNNDYWYGYYIPELNKDKQDFVAYFHNEEGPACFLTQSKYKEGFSEPCYFLFGKPLSKQQWKEQVKLIKFNTKFERLLNE